MNFLKLLMNKKIKRNIIFIFLILVSFLIAHKTLFALDENNAELKTYQDYNIENIIVDLINWKKSDVNETEEGNLINSLFLENCGQTPGDWYPIGLGRYNYPDDYTAYLANIEERVNERYNTKEKLSAAKATEWHRISLAIISMGGDPTNIGNFNNEPINLIKDGTYDRGKTVSLGRQGINGWIWGLITLDSKRYVTPDDCFNDRMSIITEILSLQLEDGGFALSGSASDIDITAMAIIALSNYYNSETVFNYSSKKIKNEDGKFIQCSKRIKDVIDEGIEFLSSAQCDDGDYYSWGTQNCESTCQVICALTSVNIDFLNDSRFIKNNNTLLDGVLKYRLTNGGFIHSKTYDQDNSTSLPDKANTMAGEQVLYTLVATYRFYNNMRHLYDMLPEFTEEEISSIVKINNDISNLSSSSSYDKIEAVLSQYYNIDKFNRNYIIDYWKLSDLCKKHSIKLLDESTTYNGKSNEDERVILYFTQKQKKEVEELDLNNLTTLDYSKIVSLRYILDNSDDFENKNFYMIKIDKAYNEINRIQNEINEINQLIQDVTVPFSKVSIKDKKEIDDIYNRIEELNDYDRDKITNLEDLDKAKTKIKNSITAILIFLSLFVTAIVTFLLIIKNIKKRKMIKKKQLMGESDE